MSDDAKPDYTTMSGAEFKRAVGADPEKWAAEFIKAATSHVALSNTERLAFSTAWFRDAMEAAVKAAEPPSVDWDKLRDRLNVTLSEHGLPNLRKPSD